jgi:hypothetical protein
VSPPCGLLGALALLAACGGSSERAYVERLGQDTMAVEVYTRTATGFEGQLLNRNPVTRVATYAGTLSEDGKIATLDVEWKTPDENPGGPGPEVLSFALEGDSATVTRELGGETTTTTVGAPDGLIPLVGRTPWSYAIMEQAIRQAVAAGGDSYEAPMINVARPRPSATNIVRVNPDTVSWSFFGYPMKAAVDAEGKVLGLSGAETTMKVMGEQTSNVDFTALAAEFAARDARGEGLGPPSPAANVSVSSAGASFEVDYSRPAKRGREVWGGELVPYDAVWRTGANAATVFSTDRDLDIGGTSVPAGEYTLWTTFTAESAHLIINEQTGQWGTAYDASQDLAHIAMMREDMDELAERFTIAIDPTDTGGVLRLRWDRSQFSVPMTVR